MSNTTNHPHAPNQANTGQAHARPWLVPSDLLVRHSCQLPRPYALLGDVIWNPASRRLECTQCGAAWTLDGAIARVAES